MKRKLVLLITLSVLGTSAAGITADASAPLPLAEGKNSVQTFSSNIVWKYKKINGVTYKRKFDKSKNKWIGGWIRC